MSDGTGMTPPPSGEASGAVSSREVGRKNPKQGLRSGLKIDTNKHGIRRETNPNAPKRTGRPKKV